MLKENADKITTSPMLRYLFYSVIVTAIDTAIVWVLHSTFLLDIVTANTIGVITGFIVHYLLASKSVFQTQYGLTGFAIYLGTFFLGLVLADWLIYQGEYYLFTIFTENLRFLFSKGVSIVLPFFVLYYLRKLLFNLLKNKASQC